MIEILPYIFIGLSILFIKFPKLSVPLNVLGLVLAFMAHRVDAIGILCTGGIYFLAWLLQRPYHSNLSRIIYVSSFVILSIALMNHLVPGFNNWALLKNVEFATDSLPFSMYLNLDKVLVGYAVGLFLLRPFESKVLTLNQIVATLKNLVLLIFIILPIGLLIHFVRFDFKFPPQGTIWLFNNLLFVCFAEEGFFRGFLQNYLLKAFPESKKGQILAVFLAAVLFGLAHFKGGAINVLLAILAGYFYGITYLKTKRLEMAILIHFAFNVFHFTCLSYPALK